MAIKVLGISEILSFRESAKNNQHVLAINDKLNLADRETNNPKNIGASNTITFKDNFKYHYGIKVARFSDTLVFKDSGHRAAAFHIIDFLHLFETARTVLGDNFSENLNFVEDIIVSAGPVVEDIISFTESISLKHRQNISLSDTITFKDFAVAYKLDPYFYAIPRDTLIPPF